MRVRRITVGQLDANCFLVDDGQGGLAVVIDPGDDYWRIADGLGAAQVAAVVLTHGHFDHLGAAGRLVEEFGAPLMVHEDDAAFITDAAGTGGAMFGFTEHVAPHADRLLAASDTVEAGELVLHVLHTPGHTPGCICLYVQDPHGGPAHLFSGDTLFAGSVGRTDFPRGDSAAMRESISTRLAPLPGDTIVHPGHGPDTTIGREARINPFWPRV